MNVDRSHADVVDADLPSPKRASSVEDYVEHLPLPVPADDVQPFTQHMLRHCPVMHTEEDGGFWIVNRHADVARVVRDAAGFASGNRGVRIRHDPPGVERPPMPPIDSNPPMHRQVREVMNPFLAPQVLITHEDRMRAVIAELIDEFADTGQCDIARDLAKRFPAHLTAELLLGVTSAAEVDDLRRWNATLTYELHRADPALLARVQAEYAAWSLALVEARRAEPRDDVVSALIAAWCDGEPLLGDLEIAGAIQILVSGGFSTTADATGSIVIRLVEDPTLEPLLRSRPELIPAAIEEVLRLDPPLVTRPRRATSDAEVGGTTIPENDRVLCNYLGANLDPEEWDDPDAFIIGRTRNRAMTFGGGPHRCIGSNMARISLRVMVEELLRRVTALRYADERGARRLSFNTFQRAIDSLPVTFTPLT